MNYDEPKTLLYVSHLRKYFELAGVIRRSKNYVKAVDDITFEVKEGETLGIVGETGCGKTTLGRAILNLTESTDGDVYLDVPEEDLKEIKALEKKIDALKGEENGEIDKQELSHLKSNLNHFQKSYSLSRISNRKMKEYRKMMQPVFQDPFSSLDPRKLIKDSIAEPMKLLTDMTSEQITDKALSLIMEIGLSEDHLYRFPHEFSGGQRQRLVIARAISIEPKLLVLDEPTSALDVSVQAQILNILKDLQKSRNMTYIFISHHLSVIRMMSDRVGVMYLGKMAELAETEALFTDMLHPYTKALMSAIPIPEPNIKRERIVLEGEIPSPANPPKGCYFHSRCQVAMRNCGWSPRDMGEAIRYMLDPYRNHEAQSLPNFTEILSDEAENNIELIIDETSKYNIEEVIGNIKVLIEKEASKPKGIRFAAITEVLPGEDSGTIIIKMLEPSIPQLKEVRKGHFVSCLIYDYNYWEKESKGKGGEDKTERSKVYSIAK
ncbi:MAG: ABC transporter ATP-binding protein [Thermoplasmataceae archaeon]